VKGTETSQHPGMRKASLQHRCGEDDVLRRGGPIQQNSDEERETLFSFFFFFLLVPFIALEREKIDWLEPELLKFDCRLVRTIFVVPLQFSQDIGGGCLFGKRSL